MGVEHLYCPQMLCQSNKNKDNKKGQNSFKHDLDLKNWLTLSFRDRQMDKAILMHRLFFERTTQACCPYSFSILFQCLRQPENEPLREVEVLEAELVVLGVRRTPADSRSDFTTLLVLLLLAEHVVRMVLVRFHASDYWW